MLHKTQVKPSRVVAGAQKSSSNATRISNRKMDLNNRQRSCPGGTCDNSPTFQRWVDQCRDHQVPKGRLKRRAIVQPSLRDWTDISLVLPNVETLGYCRASLRDEEQ